jgi:hypothetical protein
LTTDELLLNPKTKKKKKKTKRSWRFGKKNTRSPEEGKRRGNAQESTDRWTQQEHQRIKPGREYGPMDKTITPEDKTRSSTKTAG